MGIGCSLDLFMEKKRVLNLIIQWDETFWCLFLIICRTVLFQCDVFRFILYCRVSGVFLCEKCGGCMSDSVWDEVMRSYAFLSVCSASTITSHLLCSPPPADDCQLLSQIPKVRCLRNGRREGECGGTGGETNWLNGKEIALKGALCVVCFLSNPTWRCHI